MGEGKQTDYSVTLVLSFLSVLFGNDVDGRLLLLLSSLSFILA